MDEKSTQELVAVLKQLESDLAEDAAAIAQMDADIAEIELILKARQAV